MCTILVDDPIFGLYAYGGIIETMEDGLRVHPRDGLNKRFYNLTDRFVLTDATNPAPAPVKVWKLRAKR